MDSYENSLKIYRDLKGAFDTAFDDGITEGVHKVAKALKENGVTYEVISKTTGLSESEIEKL